MIAVSLIRITAIRASIVAHIPQGGATLTNPHVPAASMGVSTTATGSTASARSRANDGFGEFSPMPAMNLPGCKMLLMTANLKLLRHAAMLRVMERCRQKP